MSDERPARAPELPPDGPRVLRDYATLVVEMREHYARMTELAPPLAELSVIAQRIADAAVNPACLCVLAFAHTARDDAARAVQSAMLSARVARKAGARDSDLVSLTLAALLVDAGRQRLAHGAGIDLQVFSQLPDALDALAPAATAALGVGSARSTLLEAATLTAFETAWLERPRLGPLYSGSLAPRLSSRVVLTCRALLGRIAPTQRDDDLSPRSALRWLLGEAQADWAVLGLLVKAIGLVPAGTLLALSDGQWAIVGTQPEKLPGRPVCHGLVDTRGRAHLRPPLLDLAADSSLAISRVIEPKEAKFNAAWALVTP